jgi:alpha-mannosidase
VRSELMLSLALLAFAGSSLRAQDRVIPAWAIRGPLHADTGRAGVLRDYLDGEATVFPTVGDSVAGGPFRLIAADSTGRVNLNTLAGPSDWSVAYAHTYLWSPDERIVLLVLDSDDDIVARVNGQRVWVHVVPRGIGPGRDTVRVRLASGWNTVLVKVINRTGGFDLLGKLADAPGGGTVAVLRLDPHRPAGLTAHRFPGPIVEVGPLAVGGAARWHGAELAVGGMLSVTAWGADTMRDARVSVRAERSILLDTLLAVLAPGEPAALPFRGTFTRLRAAALGDQRLDAEARWHGGRARAALFVDPDRLLRIHDGAVDIFDPVRDTVPPPAHLDAPLVVPAALAGQPIDLEALGLGQRATLKINGTPVPFTDGVAPLCAPCSQGDSLHVVIVPDPARPLWLRPQAQVRTPGFTEYADGFRYARGLGRALPDSARPDPVTWLRALGTAHYDAVRRGAEAAFRGAVTALERDTLWLVGNSHIDAAWLWRWQETVDVIRNTWRTSLKLAEIFPGYVFAGSSGAFYDAMDRLDPGLSDSLVAATRRGSWVPVGGWWVEADQNLPSGESLVRQGLYGQRYFQRRFGRRSTIAWTPDTFGYPWTMPQILRGSGFTTFVTQKIRWNDSTAFPYDVFWWQSPDGSRVLTYNPYGYSHDLDPATLVHERVEDRAKTGIGQQIVLYGVGDHGGGPTIAMLRQAEQLARVPAFPAVRYATPERALAAVQAAEPAGGFPTWDDELYLEYHRGTYTSHAMMKRRNRESEVRLQVAEALAAVDTTPYPRDTLEAVWRRVLFNQFHDLLPGSGIDSIYRDAAGSYDTAWATLDRVTGKAFADLRSRMDTRGRGTAVVVFNAAGWTRSGWTSVTAGEAAGADTTWIQVDSVPAFGAVVVHLPAAARSRFYQGLPAPTAGPNWIENAVLRVEVDSVTGAVTRIYDKRTAREALAPGGRANVLQILDDRPAQWDAWNLMPNPETWEVKAVRRFGRQADSDAARILIERTWGNSVFQQTLVLRRDADYVDVENDVDWHERQKLLKVGFQFAVAPDSATFEIPYGTIGRSGRPRTQAERAKFEVPGQRWADVSNADYGVSVLNDGKYGWDYRNGTLRLSLLKAPIWPDSTADRGNHHFAFAVLPHGGDWRAAGIDRRAVAYNVPLVAAAEPAHRGSLGSAVGFASASPANVQVTWLKRAEDGNALVLRLVEWHGQAVDAVVTLPCDARAVRRANLLEDAGEPVPVTGHTARLAMRPHEITTLLVECAR